MSALHAAAAAAAVRTASLELMTPSGRCDRRGLLIAALMLLALQAAQAAAMIGLSVPHNHPLAVASTGVLLWLSTTAVAKRLHDLSLSAWRILWAALGVVAWSVAVGAGVVVAFAPERVEPGQAGYWTAIVATMVPVLAMTLWLHFAKGLRGANAYGPEPAGFGFSRWEAGESHPAMAAAR
mgnify:CR=1 FL=1